MCNHWQWGKFVYIPRTAMGTLWKSGLCPHLYGCVHQTKQVVTIVGKQKMREVLASTSTGVLDKAVGPSKRVNWARELLDEEAGQFIIDPNPERPWLAERMCARIPYSA
ncbi:hypothetical protein QQ045_012129 [Rhodiola kirilowii]